MQLCHLDVSGNDRQRRLAFLSMGQEPPTRYLSCLLVHYTQAVAHGTCHGKEKTILIREHTHYTLSACNSVYHIICFIPVQICHQPFGSFGP